MYRASGSVNNTGDLAFGVGAGIILGERIYDRETEAARNLKQYPEKTFKELEALKSENEQIKKEFKK